MRNVAAREGRRAKRRRTENSNRFLWKFLNGDSPWHHYEMIASFPHYMLRWVERSGSFHKTIIKRSPAWVLSLRAQIFRRFQKYQVFDLRPSKKTSTGSFGENFTTPRSTVYRLATAFIQSIFSTRRRKASTYFRFQNLRKQDSNQKTRSQSTLCKTVSLGRWIRISSRDCLSTFVSSRRKILMVNQILTICKNVNLPGAWKVAHSNEPLESLFWWAAFCEIARVNFKVSATLHMRWFQSLRSDFLTDVI